MRAKWEKSMGLSYFFGDNSWLMGGDMMAYYRTLNWSRVFENGKKPLFFFNYVFGIFLEFYFGFYFLFEKWNKILRKKFNPRRIRVNSFGYGYYLMSNYNTYG